MLARYSVIHRILLPVKAADSFAWLEDVCSVTFVVLLDCCLRLVSYSTYQHSIDTVSETHILQE